MWDEPEFWNIKETAAYMRCSEKTVRRLVKKKEITYTRRGGRTLLFRPTAVRWYLGRFTVKSSAA